MNKVMVKYLEDSNLITGIPMVKDDVIHLPEKQAMVLKSHGIIEIVPSKIQKDLDIVDGWQKGGFVGKDVPKKKKQKFNKLFVIRKTRVMMKYAPGKFYLVLRINSGRTEIKIKGFAEWFGRSEITNFTNR